MHHWQSYVPVHVLPLTGPGESVIVLHGPKLVIMGSNFRLLKTVYLLSMQGKVSKLFAIYF